MAKKEFPPLLHLSFILQHEADELLLREVGIGIGQARLLSALETTRPRLQNQIAMELRQTEANVSRQLKVMKAGGLISITKNKKDSRGRDVTLSTKGHEAYLKAERLLRRELPNLLSGSGVKLAGLLD